VESHNWSRLLERDEDDALNIDFVKSLLRLLSDAPSLQHIYYLGLRQVATQIYTVLRGQLPHLSQLSVGIPSWAAVEDLQEAIQSRSVADHLESINELECILPPHDSSIFQYEREVLQATLKAHVTHLTLRVYEPPVEDCYA